MLNQAEKDIVRRAVAFKLSIPFGNVQEKKRDPISKQVFVSAAYKMNLILEPILTNPNFPDMLSHCQLLNTAEVKAYIKSKLSTFVDSNTLVLSKYPVYTPYMTKNPELVSESKSSLTFTSSLSNYGWIYAIAIGKTSEDSSSIPSPYQIWKGYDSKNAETKSLSVEILEPNLDYNFTFDQLNSSTIYEVFVTAGSNHPGFPDLLGSGGTVSLESATRDSGSDEASNGSVLVVSMMMIVIMMWSVFV